MEFIIRGLKIGAGVLSVTLAILYLNELRIMRRYPKRRIRGHIPILGDTLITLRNVHRYHDFILEETIRHGFKPFAAWTPLRNPILFVSDEATIQHILKTKFHVYDKGPTFISRCKDLLGNGNMILPSGIFNSDGDHWKMQRKTASHIFTIKNFKDYVDTSFLSSFAAQGTVFDISDLFYRFTFDSFTRIAFGVNLNSILTESELPFMTAFDQAQEHVFLRFMSPFWQFEEFFSARAKNHAKNIAIIRKFANEIVMKRLKENLHSKKGSEKTDLLSYFMDDELSLDNNTLCDYVLNFMIAGRDTTAQALSWTFYMLHKNPRILQKLLDEIYQETDPNPTYDQIKNLKYANAVFNESLRLWPSVPCEAKEANEDDILPDGTFVPKGTFVSWFPYIMGRSTDIWGNDASDFIPERWLGTILPSQFAYPVFNGGPRVCLGKNMALLQGVYVLVSILRKFDFNVESHAKDILYGMSLTLPMKNGLKVSCNRK